MDNIYQTPQFGSYNQVGIKLESLLNKKLRASETSSVTLNIKTIYGTEVIAFPREHNIKFYQEFLSVETVEKNESKDMVYGPQEITTMYYVSYRDIRSFSITIR